MPSCSLRGVVSLQPHCIPLCFLSFRTFQPHWPSFSPLFVPGLLPAQDLCTNHSLVLGNTCVLLQLVHTLSSLSDIISTDCYENNRRLTNPVLGGRQGRFPQSWACSLIHKGAGAGEGGRESIHGRKNRGSGTERLIRLEPEVEGAVEGRWSCRSGGNPFT